jgi:hypothetical protein
MYLENKSLHLPVTSTSMRREIELNDEKSDVKSKRNLLMEEIAIYIETDALQYEMGNIIPKITVSGNIQYDTQSILLHKDRYSSLGMALEYILELENKARDSKRNESDFSIGTAYSW